MLGRRVRRHAAHRTRGHPLRSARHHRKPERSRLQAHGRLRPDARRQVLAHGPRDLVQLVVVLFPGGGAGLGGHVTDALAQAGGAVDGFPDDVRVPGVPRGFLDRVHEQRVQGGMPALLGPPGHGAACVQRKFPDRGIGVRLHPPVEIGDLLARLHWHSVRAAERVACGLAGGCGFRGLLHAVTRRN